MIHNGQPFESSEEFFESIDFPDLKEIVLFKDHPKDLLKGKFESESFIKYMDELYLLRCKIAHIKGYFTSIDLDKLTELTLLISKHFGFSNIKILIEKIKSKPNEVIISTPSNFIEDYLEKSGIINNLPIPDYEYEGGFVGREEDRKKIIQYLKSEKTPVVTLTGSGGVGKTSLALKVVQDLTERPENNIFDAIVWLSAKENKLSPLGIEDIEPTLKNYDELLDIIIKLFGFEDQIKIDSIEDKERLSEEIFDLTNKVLVIVDNLETITDERIINFILDAPLKVKFLITSRKGIGQVERRHELKELKSKEAIYLFRQLSKDKQLDKLAGVPDQIIKKYVDKVSCYPLAIKWVIGQVARGKDINKIIDSIHTTESDISKFCYDQIFSTLTENCQKLLFALALIEESPTQNILEYTVELNQEDFEDAIEELILISLVIPEQFLNEKKEIGTTYRLLALTKGYTRLQLNKNLDLREYLINRLNHVQSIVTTSERAKKEYRHSLYNFGAKSDEEKIAAIIAQTALQRYQSGFYDEAVEEYKRAIKVCPTFAPLYRNWAVMESMENHISEASNLMSKAAELDPSDPQIFVLWGNIYRKSSKHFEADKKYAVAYSLTPLDPIVLSAYGQSRSHLNYFSEADELLKNSLKSDLQYSVKHKTINLTSIAENNIEWAESLVEKRDYNPAEQKFKDAITTCESAINEDQTDFKVLSTLYKAHFKFALMLMLIDRADEAIVHLLEVIKTEPRSFKHHKYRLSALMDLAEFYSKRHQREKVSEYVSTIETDYGHSQVLKIDYRNHHQRLKLLNEYLNPSHQVKGRIQSVNSERKFAIIEEEGTNFTYLAHINSFSENMSSLPATLRGHKVLFSPISILKKGVYSRQANFVKLIDI
ncbi:NB-ARC domain-containing protein [Sphingobacterium oryzagri]|uniref:NB-ARC domain-containing protein n=1 Tax=Sphingobacterium oryzagri TaxID=3025669 RepID=A0ABY7WCD4_9SPHI|nr:NB-ARC domain-containing protein [Sphingobacterium sp. KACC 22765]WDF67142.1 NB-ARC domain-containing protein [Sphingobacterium sp. KACC 22765]